MIFIIILYLALAAELNNFRVQLGSYLILNETWYKFSFAFNQEVEGVLVLIFFPSNVQFSSFQCTVLGPNVLFSCSRNGNDVSLELKGKVSLNDSVTVEIDGVINPAPGKVYDLRINALNETLGLSDSSKITVEYLALPLESASLLSSSQVCGELSNWTVNLTLVKELPENSSLLIGFPFWNKNLNPGELVEEFWEDETYCQPFCEKRERVLVVDLEKGTVGNYSMTIYLIKNPPSTEAVTGFNFSIVYNNGTFFDSFDLEVPISCSEVNSLKSTELVLTEYKVNSPSRYQVSFITTNPLPVNAFITIQLPSSVALTGSSVTPISGINNLSFTSTQSGKKLTLSSILSSYKAGGLKFFFSLNNCTNPGSSSAFNIQISTGYSNFQSDSSSSFISAAYPGSLQVHQISSALESVNQISSMQFKLSSSEPISKGFSLVVQFPEGLSLQSSLFVASTSTSSAAVSQVIKNSIFIQNLFSSDVGTGTFAFYVTNVKNPGTTKSRCCFLIQIFTGNEFLYQVANNSIFSFQALPGLCQVRVEPASFVTGNVTEYLFEIFIENPLSENGTFLIEVPQEIENSVESVLVSEGMNLGFKFILIGTKQIRFEKVFVEEFSGRLEFIVKSFKNPVSFKESSSFLVSTFEDSVLVDLVTSGVTVKMNETHRLDDLSVFSSSNVVSAQTSLTFRIVTFNSFPSVIHIVPPASVVFSKSITCTLSESVLMFCTVINGVLKTEFSDQKSSQITLKISNLKNPPSTEPVSFKVTTSKDQYNMDSSNISLQVTTPAVLKSLRSSLSSSYISEQSTQTLAYSFSTQFPSSGSLEISFSFITSAVKCYSGGQEMTSSASEGLVIIKSILSNTGEITLKNLINPSEAGTFPVTVTSKTSLDYLVEQQQVFLTITCKSPCKTCAGVASFCTSCGENFPYLYDETCHSKCKSGFYATSLKTCESCSYPCQQCEGSSTRCVECLEGYLLGFECLEKCSVGYYPSGKICVSCILPCKNCESKEKCLECSAPYTLSSSTCIISCPDPQISFSGACVSCENCLTCKTSPNSCTSCSPNLNLFKSSCVSICPSGSFPKNSICESCSSNCLTCEFSSSSCSSCPSGWVLESSSCISECSEGFYSSKASCILCEYPCKTCESSTSCLTCFEGLLLQGKSCVNKCDSGFFASGSLCEPCPVSCSSCLSSSLCTSCLSRLNLFHTSCVSECPSGFFASGGLCLDCLNCEVCSEDGCLSSCSEGKVYLNGTCLEKCPNRTVEVESVCISCQGCLDCLGSPTNCSSCEEGMVLFEGICLKSCPQGYSSENSSCVLNETGFCADGCPFELFNNSVCDSSCNNEQCKFDNAMCSDDYQEESVRRSDEFEVQQNPFIISAISAVIAGVSAAVSLFVGGQFSMIACPFVACLEAITKICLLGSINEADGFKGRVLLSQSQKFDLILGGMVGVFTLHYLINFCFVIFYWVYLRRTDYLHKTWTRLHCWGIVLLTCLMTCFSFKTVLLLVAKIPRVELFDAKFESSLSFRKVFRFFGILQFFVVFVPFLALCAVILVSFSPGSLTFSICVDCALLEIFSQGFTFFAFCSDSESSVVKYLESKKTVEESSNTVVVTESIVDFTKRNQGSFKEEPEVEESEQVSTPPSSEGTVVNYPGIISGIRIKKPVLSKKHFSFSLANISPSHIISEEMIDFDDFQIDLDDLRRVYLKLHGYQSKLPVVKDFYPPLIIDADGQVIEADLNLSDYELIGIDPENPKIGEFRHKAFNTRVRLVRDFSGSAIESFQLPDPDSDPTMKNPILISPQENSPNLNINDSSLKSTSKVSITTLFRSGSPPKGILSRSLYPHPGLSPQLETP